MANINLIVSVMIYKTIKFYIFTDIEINYAL